MISPFVWIRKIRNRATRGNACAELIVFIIQLYALYCLLCIIHTETYVFQCTQLGELLRPVRRTRCSLIPHTLNECYGNRKRKERPMLPTSIAAADKAVHLRSREQAFMNTSDRIVKVDDMMGIFDKLRSSGRKQKLSIALLYLYDGSSSGGNGNDGGESWSEPLMLRVIRNRKEYCLRHGYILINANHLLDKSRPAAWSKLKAVDHLLYKRSTRRIEMNSQNKLLNDSNKISVSNSENRINAADISIGNSTDRISDDLYSYDYIMYIDMDVIIMDLNKPLEEFIHAAHDVIFDTDEEDNNKIKRKKIEFLMTEDWNGPNTGNWFVHNVQDSITPSLVSMPSSISSTSSSSSSSSISAPSSTGPPLPIMPLTFPHWFLQTAWAQSHLLKKKSPLGLNHPFEYEQRALHFLLDTPVWRDRGLQRFRGEMSVEDIRSHFLFFPQCSFNSYSLHPFDFRGDREISQFVSGDFLIHFAGKKGRKKVLLMEYYLSISEKKY